MLAFLAAVLAASTPTAPATPTTPATASPPLEASMPWWERITVVVDDKGKQQSCTYQSSLSAKGVEECDEDMAASAQGRGAGRTGVYSKLTFERRFSPGAPDSGRLQPGDKLLGRQVMFLTINAEGAIESCRDVSTSGEAPPEYNCDEAQKEQFRAQASAGSAPPRQAFLTVLAYGHQEQIA